MIKYNNIYAYFIKYLKWILNLVFRKHIFLTSLIIVYIIFLIFPFPIIPDFLRVTDINISEYYNLIITTTAAIFSILFAVVLLVHQLTINKNIRRDSRQLVLNHWAAIMIIDFSIFLILAGLISKTHIHKVHIKQINTAYFLTYEFIVYILLLIPCLKNFLSKTDSFNQVLIEIETFTYKNFITINNSTDFKLLSLFDEIVLAIKNGDYVMYSNIIKGLSDRMIILIGIGNDRHKLDKIFNQYSNFLTVIIPEAIKNNDERFLNMIWDDIAKLYKYGSDNKILLLHYQRLEYFIDDYIEALFENNELNIINKAVLSIIDIFKIQLKNNCPNQADISSLYHLFEDNYQVQHNVSASVEWEQMREFLWTLQEIQRKAIEIQNSRIFKKCSTELRFLTRDLISRNYDHLGNYQIDELLFRIITFQCYYAEKALNKNLFDQMHDAFEFEIGVITNLVDKESKILRNVVQSISDLMIRSQRIGKLDEFSSLNNWTAIARSISESYTNNESAKRTTIFVVNTLAKLKDEIETNDQFDNNYIEIRNNLESIKRFLLERNPNIEIPFINDIDNILNNFMDGKLIESTDNIIEW